MKWIDSNTITITNIPIKNMKSNPYGVTGLRVLIDYYSVVPAGDMIKTVSVSYHGTTVLVDSERLE